MSVTLVIGKAGTGKTWVMKELIKHYKCDVRGAVGLICYHRSSKVIVVGKYDGATFDGSDRLSMACMRDLPRLLEKFKGWDIFMEGDRWMNKSVVALPGIRIIKILGDGAEGRELRGSTQSERQLKSLATRVKNIQAHVEVKNSQDALKLLLK